MRTVFRELLSPKELLSCRQVLVRPCPVPKAPGVYAWYFRDIPPGVPTTGCHKVRGLTLLYIGISPCRPPTIDARRAQSIGRRVRYHARGNSAGSTLRLSLGCLLARPLGIALRRVGSGERMTFGPGEKLLSDWMLDNAFVAWSKVSAPWLVEKKLIARLCLPLNIDGNAHSFSKRLSSIRGDARTLARRLPIGHEPKIAPTPPARKRRGK